MQGTYTSFPCKWWLPELDHFLLRSVAAYLIGRLTHLATETTSLFPWNTVESLDWYTWVVLSWIVPTLCLLWHILKICCKSLVAGSQRTDVSTFHLVFSSFARLPYSMLRYQYSPRQTWHVGCLEPLQHHSCIVVMIFSRSYVADARNIHIFPLQVVTPWVGSFSS